MTDHHDATAIGRDGQRKSQIIAPPRIHDGLIRALKGSFNAVPVLPDEFSRLLDRLG